VGNRRGPRNGARARLNRPDTFRNVPNPGGFEPGTGVGGPASSKHGVEGEGPGVE
jgi:hypothetical protein